MWDRGCSAPGTRAARSSPHGAFRDRPNPFKNTDKNVGVLGGAGGGAALPYRPAPLFNNNDPLRNHEAQGIFYPSFALARELRNDNFDNHDQNFSQDQLSWNHGASQKTWRELKEFYFDLEMFDSRLWLRIGKQNIVWGKTELFRTTDQFNPQDLALASLPSLEESRIAVWAARGVCSFYEVGPLEDVRLELALNFDTFEPTDLGQCGEPYCAASGLQQALRPVGPRHRRGRHRRRDPPAPAVARSARRRDRRAARVPLESFRRRHQ